MIPLQCLLPSALTDWVQAHQELGELWAICGDKDVVSLEVDPEQYDRVRGLLVRAPDTIFRHASGLVVNEEDPREHFILGGKPVYKADVRGWANDGR